MNTSMQATYQLESSELTPEFIEIIKKTFNNKRIEIAVYEVDETQYLMKGPNNYEHLSKAVKNADNSINLISVDYDEIVKAADEEN